MISYGIDTQKEATYPATTPGEVLSAYQPDPLNPYAHAYYAKSTA